MSAETTSFPQRIYQPEPGSTQIVLIRHGQSQPFNPEQPFPLVDGRGDPPLTDLGHDQARRLADRLHGEAFSAIYVSNLTRTGQTAAPLAGRLGLTAVVEPDLAEVRLGEAEGGRLRQLIAEGDPLAVRMRAVGDWGVIPGAETNAEVRRRTVGALDRIVTHHPDELVAVVCHGGVIGSILSRAAGSSPFLFNGSRHTALSHLVIGPGGWVIRSFNDAGHVGPLTEDHQLP
ncbi:MAG: histidine phosphatase family protein [Acidimicrobiales bacterium]